MGDIGAGGSSPGHADGGFEGTREGHCRCEAIRDTSVLSRVRLRCRTVYMGAESNRAGTALRVGIVIWAGSETDGGIIGGGG